MRGLMIAGLLSCIVRQKRRCKDDAPPPAITASAVVSVAGACLGIDYRGVRCSGRTPRVLSTWLLIACWNYCLYCLYESSRYRCQTNPLASKRAWARLLIGETILHLSSPQPNSGYDKENQRTKSFRIQRYISASVDAAPPWGSFPT